jgi:hypothetical protein
MTHSLSADAQRFLSQDAQFTVSDIRGQPSLIPSEPGIYGWWFDPTFLPSQAVGTLSRGGLRLLYIGIAPKGATEPSRKSRTIRDRLKNHCRGPLSTSTLRRTLAALLNTNLELEIGRRPSGKLFMNATNEHRLSLWMDQHAKISCMIIQEPWFIEDELLSAGPPFPLNISGSTNPFRQELKKLRAHLTNRDEFGQC